MHRNLLHQYGGRRSWVSIWYSFLLALLFFALAPFVVGQDDGLKSLRAGFKDAPADSRIMVRWWWFGPSVTKPELERELRAMKEGGIGGVEIQPVYPQALDDPEHGFHNFAYLSDEFIDDLRFANDKARELGMRVDLTLGSGWPFGGPHIPITQAAGKLRVVSVSISPDVRSTPVPSVEVGEKLVAAFLTSSGTRDRVETASLDLSTVQDGRLPLPAQPRTIWHRSLVHRQPHRHDGQASRNWRRRFCSRSLRSSRYREPSGDSWEPLDGGIWGPSAVRGVQRQPGSL